MILVINFHDYMLTIHWPILTKSISRSSINQRNKKVWDSFIYNNISTTDHIRSNKCKQHWINDKTWTTYYTRNRKYLKIYKLYLHKSESKPMNHKELTTLSIIYKKTIQLFKPTMIQLFFFLLEVDSVKMTI